MDGHLTSGQRCLRMFPPQLVQSATNKTARALERPSILTLRCVRYNANCYTINLVDKAFMILSQPEKARGSRRCLFEMNASQHRNAKGKIDCSLAQKMIARDRYTV